MSEVTRLLNAIEAGQPHAAEQLLPAVYDELRQLAARKLAHEEPGQTLDATALVHEAYLRLVGDQQFANRRHFFAAAAEAMRRILIENARRKQSQKRGGDRQRVDLGEIAAPEAGQELIAVDDSLAKLALADPLAAEVVKLRYFAGLSMSEVADLLEVSPRTADRLWAFARAWLHRELYGQS